MYQATRSLADMAYENKHYTDWVDCPAHPGEHSALLYQYPHRHAGIWECVATGESGSCEHEDTHMDSATQDHMGFQGHYQTEHPIVVCSACEVTVDEDPTNPDEDY